jgi:murein DD-endopeptidase MepM/ murein hydrolase activator NlpD
VNRAGRALLVPAALALVLPLALGAVDQDGAGVAGIPQHPDIPPRAAVAYVAGAAHASAAHPGCDPSWALLAGIGKVETDHGRHGGSTLGPDGRAVPPILGVLLDGSLPGTAAIADSDGGALDGTAQADRAVGPMQFIPATWARLGVDVDRDGVADPQDVDDAAGSAAGLLCGAATELTTEAGRRSALFAYNRSTAYADAVLAWADLYTAEATHPVGDAGAGPIACPVTPPVRFIDSWHFPRSGGRVHEGQDLFAAEGQPLVALADAVVTEMRVGAGLGGTVLWLRTHQGGDWYYAHLRAFAPGLRAGDQVRRGQVVGFVGRTGNAATTPPHLHIQWRPSGRQGPDVNPFPLLSAACPGHEGG